MALREKAWHRLVSTTAGNSEPRHDTGTPRRVGTVGDALVGTSPLEVRGSSTESRINASESRINTMLLSFALGVLRQTPEKDQILAKKRKRTNEEDASWLLPPFPNLGL